MPKIIDPYLKREIEYIPETGEVKGAVCSPNRAWRIPYNVVYFDGVQMKVCNLAWKIMTGEWPKKLVDHKNRNSLDDRWNNLRLVTFAQNGRNRTKPKNSLNKYIGVSYRKDSRWRYHFTIEGERYRRSGYKCETSCALARDKHILRLNEQYTTLNILEREYGV